MGGTRQEPAAFRAGQLNFSLRTLGTRVKGRHDDVDIVVGQGADPVPIQHDTTMTLVETRLDVSYGLTSSWALDLSVPLRVLDTFTRYLDPAGAEVELVSPSIHHRTETLVGPADPVIDVRYGRVLGDARRWRVEARLGTSLPIGGTEEDPYQLGDMGLPHQHVQFGTGTFDPLLGLAAARSFDGWQLAAWAMTQQMLYENDQGYLPGDRYAGGALAATSFGLRRWEFRVTAQVLAETAEEWGGITHHDEGNQGRVDLMAGVGASVRLTSWLSIDAVIDVPVYTHVVGGQLEYPLVASLGLSASFDLLGGGGDVDGDDGGDGVTGGPIDPVKRAPTDWTGLDVADLAKGGADAELVATPGKLTIIDFWATWCAPCGELDDRLADLARRHAGLFAVRKVEVVDWESPSAKRHLLPRKFGMPHVKVLGLDGAVLMEQSGDPAKIVAAVEALLPPGRRIDIEATEAGYEPARVEVRRGERVILVFTRRTDATCATDVYFDVPEGGKVSRDLPLGVPVELSMTFDSPGAIRYGCSMDRMFAGEIVVSD